MLLNILLSIFLSYVFFFPQVFYLFDIFVGECFQVLSMPGVLLLRRLSVMIDEIAGFAFERQRVGDSFFYPRWSYDAWFPADGAI